MSVNARFLSVRTAAGEFAKLENAYYGEHGSVTFSGTVVTELNEDGEEERELRQGEASAIVGHYFGGNATSTADMDLLKNSSKSATYLGSFNGFAAAAET